MSAGYHFLSPLQCVPYVDLAGSRSDDSNASTSDTLQQPQTFAMPQFNTPFPAHKLHDSLPGPAHVEPDPVKHRRSRNGCFTCRHRRVKCDETRPACNRCRKGCRNCVYPDLNTTTKTSKNTSKTTPTAEDEYPENTRTPVLTPSKSASPATQVSPVSVAPTGINSEQPKLKRSESLSSLDFSDDNGTASFPKSSIVKQEILRSSAHQNFSGLDADLSFYLEYHRRQLTHHHYGLNYDGCGFLQAYLIEQAVNDDALLYAVVAFASYHHTMSKPGGKLQDFLGYYSKSLSLLRQSLRKGEDYSIAKLLTVLQLALLEEFLGDWVNLLSHQKAAYNILTNMFTPQSIGHDRTLNKILEWYIRFDLFAGFIGGRETVLSRDWFDAQHQYYVEAVKRMPDDLALKFEETHCSTRLLATDVAILFAKKSRGAISEDEFSKEAAALEMRFANWLQDMDPMLLDQNAIMSEVGRLPWETNDSETPSIDVVLYGNELWTTNFLILHFLSMQLMFKSQLAITQNKRPPPEVMTTPLKIFCMFDAIERLDPTPGAVHSAQASFGMTCFFLRKEPEQILWCRQKLAKIEAMGYIYPPAFRKRLSDAWGIDVTRWWLPDDEGYTPILKSIHEFIEYRTSPPSDRHRKDMREMAGIFSALNLEDSPRAAEPTLQL